MRRGLPSLRGASLNSPVSTLACSRQRSSSWTTSRPTSLLPASLASRPSSSEKPLRPSPTSRIVYKPHNLLSHALFDIGRVEMRTLWKEKIVEALTPHLVLAPDAAIDLQMHTTYSDGTWTPEQLIAYLVHERFGLGAITDHDRVDTVTSLQQLAAEKQLPILAAVEMSTSWKGELTDVLCYGFDPEQNVLQDVAQDIAHHQRENTREVYENLRKMGYPFPNPQELEALVEKPSAQQPHALLALLKQQGYGTGEPSAV